MIYFCPGRRRGFTMLEMILAMSLFAAVMVSSYPIFNLGIQVWKRTQGRLLYQQKAQLAVERMARDLRTMMLTENEDLKGYGRDDEVYFPAEVHFPDAEGKDRVTPGRVSYTYNTLTKEICRGEETPSLIFSDQPASCRPIASKIKFMKLRYWMYSGIGSSYSWYDRWDASEPIPKAIEIKIALEDRIPGEKINVRSEYEKVVIIPTGGKPEETEKSL